MSEELNKKIWEAPKLYQIEVADNGLVIKYSRPEKGARYNTREVVKVLPDLSALFGELASSRAPIETE